MVSAACINHQIRTQYTQPLSFPIGTTRRTLLGFDLDSACSLNASKADVFRVDYFEVQMGHCNVANGCIVAELLSFDILVLL